MEFETGDIIIQNKSVGHVLMCYKEGISDATFIHATYWKDFHITNQMETLDSTTTYLVDGTNYWHFRPTNILDTDKLKLQAVADNIATSAKYGIFRAIRLDVGDSSFDEDAKSRLNKYKERLKNGLADEKLVTTITCSESVILCYQLTFEQTSPYFIKKDAAHTMPRTLAAYLNETSSWETIKSP